MAKKRSAPIYVARNTSLFTTFELAESFGVSRHAIIGEIGLSSALLVGVGAKVPAHFVVDAVECAAAKTGRSDFGLLLGERKSHRFIGPLGLLIEQASTFGEALKFELRFFHLHNNSMRNVLVRQGPRTLLQTAILDKGMFEPRHYIEAVAVLRTRVARLFLGPYWLPGMVMLRHKRLSNVGTYERFLGPDVRFEQAHDAIEFTAAELSRKRKSHEPEVKRGLEAMLQDLDAKQSAQARSKASRFTSH